MRGAGPTARVSERSTPLMCAGLCFTHPGVSPGPGSVLVQVWEDPQDPSGGVVQCILGVAEFCPPGSRPQAVAGGRKRGGAIQTGPGSSPPGSSVTPSLSPRTNVLTRRGPAARHHHHSCTGSHIQETENLYFERAAACCRVLVLDFITFAGTSLSSSLHLDVSFQRRLFPASVSPPSLAV